MISLVASILFMSCVFKNEVKPFSIKNILIMICFALLTSLLYELGYTMTKTFVFCAGYVVLFKRIFKFNIYQSLMYAIIFILFLAVSEIIVILFVTKVIMVSMDYFYDTFVVSVLSNTIICGGAVLLGYLNRKWVSRLIRINLRYNLLFYVILLFSCLIAIFYLTFNNIGKQIGMYAGIAVICILLFIILNLIVQAQKNNELMIKYDKLLEFIKKYEIEIDNQRIMRHEIKNQLLTIKSKIVDGDNNKNLINYIDEILADNKREIKHSEYAKLNALPPNGIKGLFYFKVSEANDRKINVAINISKDIRDSLLATLNSVTFNQVGKLFGILLDNAIEGSDLAEDKKIGIEMYVDVGKVVFIISNTFKNRIGNGFGLLSNSTKGDKRGHGLLLAKTIVGSNNRLELETSVTDKIYTQKLIIK